MSRSQQARKAAKQSRRRKRLAARGARWLEAAEVELDALADEIAAAAKEFDTWITSRGWVIDAGNATDDVVSWVYPPSASEVADEAEPVTRVWISIVGDEDDFPQRVNAVLVGTGADGAGFCRVAPDRLVDRIEELEAYRPGDPAPEFA